MHILLTLALEEGKQAMRIVTYVFSSPLILLKKKPKADFNFQEDQNDNYAAASRETREGQRASLSVEPFSGQVDNIGTDQQRNTNELYQESGELTTEKPSQIFQASQERGQLQQQGSSQQYTGTEQQYTGAGEQYVDPGLLSETTEEPSQIIQSSQERDRTEPPITKEEVQAELELVLEEVKEAEQKKGGPLNKEDMEELEEKLEGEPWYKRFSTGVSKFFSGVFSR